MAKSRTWSLDRYSVQLRDGSWAHTHRQGPSVVRTLQLTLTATDLRVRESRPSGYSELLVRAAKFFIFLLSKLLQETLPFREVRARNVKATYRDGIVAFKQTDPQGQSKRFQVKLQNMALLDGCIEALSCVFPVTSVSMGAAPPPRSQRPVQSTQDQEDIFDQQPPTMNPASQWPAPYEDEPAREASPPLALPWTSASQQVTQWPAARQTQFGTSQASLSPVLHPPIQHAPAAGHVAESTAMAAPTKAPSASAAALLLLGDEALRDMAITCFADHAFVDFVERLQRVMSA